MKKLLSCTALVACAVLIDAGPARADCSPFFQPGSGATLSGDARCIIFSPGDGENLRAGDQNGSSGNVTVTNGITVNIESGVENAPFVAIGRSPGAVGSLNIESGATLNVDSGTTGGGAVHVGREGTGLAVIGNGGTLSLSGTGANNSVSVGMTGGNGTLQMNNGALDIVSDTGAFMFVGRASGTGRVDVTNGSTVRIEETAAGGASGAGLVLGRDRDIGNDTDNTSGLEGGRGIMTVESGSSVTVHSQNNFSAFNVAREEDTQGDLTIDNASVSVSSGTDEARIQVGRETGSFGTLDVTNGGLLSAVSVDSSLQIGVDAGSTGVVRVNEGGKISITGSGQVRVGAAFSDFGRESSGAGFLAIDGAGSEVRADDNAIIGAPEQLGGGEALGVVQLSEGGTLAAPTVFVGTGGIVAGNGTVDGNLVVDGGTVSPGLSPGTLKVTGDLTVRGGLLAMEVGGTTPGSFDILEVAGDFIGADPFTLQLDFIDGFAPGTGDSFELMSIAGDAADLDALFAASLIDLQVGGLQSGQTASLGFNGAALTAAIGTLAAVPLPASILFLLAGLAGLGVAGRRG